MGEKTTVIEAWGHSRSLPGITRTLTEAERAQVGRKDAKTEEAKRKGKLRQASVTPTEGQAALERDLRQTDTQQLVLINDLADSHLHGYRVIQGVSAAGSGKTRVIVLGVALIYYRGAIPPDQIIVTTFTKKAAEELQERLCRYIPSHVVFSQMRVGTFHSGPVGMRAVAKAGVVLGELTDLGKIIGPLLLWPKMVDGPQKNGKRVPLPYDPLVPDIFPFDLLDVLEQSMGKAAADYVDCIENKLQCWGMTCPEDVYKLITGPKPTERSELERYTRVRKTWTSATAGQEEWAREYYSQAEKDKRSSTHFSGKQKYAYHGPGRPTLPFLADIWTGVNKILTARGRFTFNTLLERYWQHAERDRTVRLFVVDEAQDDTWQQLQIANTVAKANGGTLCLIGDLRQSVYSFRGADPTIFQFAGSDLDASMQEIGTNYRSAKWIVAAGNRACLGEDEKPAPWSIGAPAKAYRTDPGVVTDITYPAKLGQSKRIRDADTAEDDEGSEAPALTPAQRRSITSAVAIRKTCEEIAERVQAPAGTSPNAIAVICRTNAALGRFELELLSHQVKVRYAGNMTPFMLRAPITRMLRILALLSGWMESAEAVMECLWSDILHGELGGYRPCVSGMRRASREALEQQATETWEETHDGLRCLTALSQVVPRRGKANWREGVEDIVEELQELQALPWALLPGKLARALIRWEVQDEESREVRRQERGGEAHTPPPPAEPDDEPAESFYAHLADIATSFDTFSAFMGYVATARAPQRDTDNAPAVTLTTVHKAKGLEFPIVYVLAGDEWPSAKDAQTGAALDEAQRTYYVALTRAQNELHLRSGGAPSPFTNLVFRGPRGILAQMAAEKIAIKRAHQLAVVDIHEIEGGYGIFRRGCRQTVHQQFTWNSRIDAEDSYLDTPSDTADSSTPLGDHVANFLPWLIRQAPEAAELVQTPQGRRLVESLYADEEITKILGWATLGDLFPGEGAPLEIRSKSGVLLGYLLQADTHTAPVFHGYLELRAPWSDYQLGPIPPEAVVHTYGQRFQDGTTLLLEARRAYAMVLPEDRARLGAMVPPVPRSPLRDAPLVEIGPEANDLIPDQDDEPEWGEDDGQ